MGTWGHRDRGTRGHVGCRDTATPHRKGAWTLAQPAPAAGTWMGGDSAMRVPSTLAPLSCPHVPISVPLSPLPLSSLCWPFCPVLCPWGAPCHPCCPSRTFWGHFVPLPSDALPCAVSPAVTSCGLTRGARTTSRGPHSTGLGAGRGQQDVPLAVWNGLTRSHQTRGHQFLACPCAAGERRVSPPCCGLQIVPPQPPAAASSSPARPCMRPGTPQSPTAGDIPVGGTPMSPGVTPGHRILPGCRERGQRARTWQGRKRKGAGGRPAAVTHGGASPGRGSRGHAALEEATLPKCPRR